MKILALTLVAVSLLVIGCSQESNSKSTQAAKMQMPPLPVKAFEVHLQEMTFSKTYSALLKPFKEVAVVARVTGVLQKKNFIEGSYVREGSLLYEIQKNEYKAALDSALATKQKAEANFEKVSKDFKRAEYLFKNKAISEQQYDDLLYQYDDARANLEGAKATLAKAKIEYDYTTIKAPISGLIGISSSDEGSYISAQNATLSTITALESVYAEFSLPNSDVLEYRSQIKVGSKVSVRRGEHSYEGVIDFIAPKLDAKTDTLLVRATFPNKKQDLVIGSFVEIKVDGFALNNVALIPQYALVKTPEAVMVYVIQEGGALLMKPVETAFVKDGNAVVTAGLSEGDKIVVSNIAKLRPNSKVSIVDGN